LFGARGRCRVENLIKGVADSQIWESSFPFIIPDMISVSSWDHWQCVEAAEADDEQLREEIGLVDDIANEP
jgi:hypothetical protein